MRVRDFVSFLRESVDAAVARGAADTDLVAYFLAPSSGFCGPGVRPKWIAETIHGPRYGLTLRQGRDLLGKLTGERPPRSPEGQVA